MQPRFHTSIVKTIQSDDYNVDDNVLETLVNTKVKAGKVDDGIGDTYLSVLLKRSQNEMAGQKRDEDSQLAAIDRAHKGMYKVVKRAVITPEISDQTKSENRAERDRRGGFARSSASVLRRYVKSGGSLFDLEPGKVRKTAMEKAAKELEHQAREAAGENTPEAKVAKRLASLITALNQIEDNKARMAARDAAVATLNKSVA